MRDEVTGDTLAERGTQKKPREKRSEQGVPTLGTRIPPLLLLFITQVYKMYILYLCLSYVKHILL